MKKAPTPPKTFKQIGYTVRTVRFLRLLCSPKPGPNSQVWGVLFFMVHCNVKCFPTPCRDKSICDNISKSKTPACWLRARAPPGAGRARVRREKIRSLGSKQACARGDYIFDRKLGPGFGERSLRRRIWSLTPI